MSLSHPELGDLGGLTTVFSLPKISLIQINGFFGFDIKEMNFVDRDREP